MTVNLELTRLSEKLGLTPSELAKLVGIARNTLRTKSATRKVDAALRPIAGRAGKTAYDLVGEGKTDDVLAYLEAVRAGVHV